MQLPKIRNTSDQLHFSSPNQFLDNYTTINLPISAWTNDS